MNDTATALGTAVFLGLVALVWAGIALRAVLRRRGMGRAWWGTW